MIMAELENDDVSPTARSLHCNDLMALQGLKARIREEMLQFGVNSLRPPIRVA
jgi:hypothetical protein